ncbi:MAG TPA: hypothetical protein VJQ47_05200 [Steroidobacteraceae bacterium]|nr:hypothetical protein [Steroidobacteraceae bacterium]
MTERLHEIAFTEEEIQTILAECGSDSLLIGGQALAVWATLYGVARPAELAAGISSDLDFLATATSASALQESLKGWILWVSAPDDPSVNTAKLTQRVGHSGFKQIDFLASIQGLSTAAIRRRGVPITLKSGKTILVLHPLDVLESRLQNLLSLPQKRTVEGIAQARLAIEVAKRFILQQIVDREPVRTVWDAIGRVSDIATNRKLTRVFFEFELDILAAVPAAQIPYAAFQTKRWPQLQADFARLLESHRRRIAPRS